MQFVIRLENLWLLLNQWMIGACPFTNSGIERAEVVSYFLLKVLLRSFFFWSVLWRRKRLAIFVALSRSCVRLKNIHALRLKALFLCILTEFLHSTWLDCQLLMAPSQDFWRVTGISDQNPSKRLPWSHKNHMLASRNMAEKEVSRGHLVEPTYGAG